MFTPIVGTLGYIVSADGKQTLLVHRSSRAGDQHFGKYNGLGGKMRDDEDVVGCLRREVREESGLECDEIVLRGIISWPGFGPAGEHWLGCIFRIDRFHGDCFTENEEGTLAWHDIAALHRLPMWEGDRYFLDMVFDDDPRIFSGWMPYKNGRPVAWRCERFFTGGLPSATISACR